MSDMRAGYKQTEVGVIPEDWDVVSLRDVSVVSSGTTPPRSQHGRYYKNGIYPWVKTGDLNNGIITRTDEAISENALREISLKLYPSRTVLVAMYGGFAQIGRNGLVSFPAAVNQAISAVQCDRSALHPEFLLSYLNYRIGFWKSVASSSRKDPNITGNDVRNFRLPIPPLSEQQAIAEALGDADALIDELNALIAKKRDIKQGAMQELLNRDRRLPGFKGDWDKCQLGDCLTRSPFYGINAAAAPYSDKLPRYLRITDISDDGRLVADSYASVDHPDTNRYQLVEGDVVLARTGASVGKSFVFCETHGPLVFAGFLICLRPDQRALASGYLSAVLQTADYWNWVASVSMRSGQPGINGREYASMPLSLPAIDEQRAIAAVLSDMDAAIVALEDKLAKARAVKQGMMQVLLTGEIRLI